MICTLNEMAMLKLETFCCLLMYCVSDSSGLYKLIFGKRTTLAIEKSK